MIVNIKVYLKYPIVPIIFIFFSNAYLHTDFVFLTCGNQTKYLSPMEMKDAAMIKTIIFSLSYDSVIKKKNVNELYLVT